MKRACLLASLISLAVPLRAQMQRTLAPNDQRARDIFEQLININTTGSSGSTTVAAITGPRLRLINLRSR